MTTKYKLWKRNNRETILSSDHIVYVAVFLSGLPQSLRRDLCVGELFPDDSGIWSKCGEALEDWLSTTVKRKIDEEIEEAQNDIQSLIEMRDRFNDRDKLDERT